MSVYYLNRKDPVSEMIKTVQAGMASLSYFDHLEEICRDVNISLDDAILLQRINEMTTGRYVDAQIVFSAGLVEEDLYRLKDAGWLLGMRDSERTKQYVMVSPRAQKALEAISSAYEQDGPVIAPKIDSADVQRIMQAADKVFQKYQ